MCPFNKNISYFQFNESFKKLALGLMGFPFFIVLHSSIPFEKQSLSYNKTTFGVCDRLSVLFFFFCSRTFFNVESHLGSKAMVAFPSFDNFHRLHLADNREKKNCDYMWFIILSVISRHANKL